MMPSVIPIPPTNIHHAPPHVPVSSQGLPNYLMDLAEPPPENSLIQLQNFGRHFEST